MPRRRLVVVLFAGLLAAACGSGAPSLAPEGGSSTPAVSAPASEPVAAGSSDQTETEWGTIWDAVPAGFPTYPGSQAAEVGADPASEVRVIDGAEAAAVASWMDERLRAAAFRSDGLSGPFEDGSYVVDASGEAGCRVQVRVAPTGGLTTITVLYGAACPRS